MKLRFLKKKAKWFHKNTGLFASLNPIKQRHFAKADRKVSHYLMCRNGNCK